MVLIRDYRIQNKLGSGCFGVVHKAISNNNNECVAIKVPKNTNDTFFLKEIAISRHISKINSKYLLKCYGFQTSNGTEISTCVIHEYFNGENLEDILIRGCSFSEDDVRPIFKNIMLGIKDLHNNFIIHHDIKLENILCNENNDIKIIDYGFARRSYALKRSRGIKTYGTPIYISPELFISGKYDNKVDIWSAGVCLYRLLTNKFPFNGGSLRQLKKNVYKGCITYPICMSDNAKDLIDHMLTLKPNKRYDVHQVLTHPFFINS